MHIQLVLKQMGYTENEAKLYLAALKLGEANLADLSAELRIPRTTLKELLESMHEKGLMHFYIKRGHRYWLAVNPDKLLVNLEERRAALKAIMPDLKALHREVGGAPHVQVYIGINDLKHIMDDILETQHNILALVSWDDWIETMGPDFVENFIERRFAHNLRVKLISPRSHLSEHLKSKDPESLRQTKFLSDQIELRRTSNFIYGSKTAMISLNPKRPTGIIIDDPEVAHAMTIYFECLWQHSASN